MCSILRLIIALLLASTICQALPDLHKQMSTQQLQSVFHVDTHDAVPHYEVVQLLHHTPHRQRRSIEPAAAAPLPPHHVKKDLSKNAYYSELKQQASSGGGRNHLLDLSGLKAHNVSFSAFGRPMNLTLRATQGLFKGSPHQLRMWTVGSEPNATHGLDLQEIGQEHNPHEIGEVFQDEDNMAAILMRRHMQTGDLIMEGSIGHDMVIKPLPHELSPNKEEAHHVVYKREAAATDSQMSDFAFMEPDDLLASEKLERLQRRQKRATSERRRSSFKDFEDLNDEDEGALDAEAEPQMAESRTRARRQAPYIIYPEVLVIVDYDGYRLHGGDNLQVKRYFISFWNGVDLRYRLLKGPRIRISIAGIIISRGRDATPYLERNRVGRDAIDSAAALTDMGKYLFRERRLPVYDIAVAITKYDMCRRRKGGRCTKGTAGFAYVGGACVVNKRLEKVNSVAIIEDTGGFSGIIVAAHEVGHLLGAVHDGSPPPSYLGGPGAQRCRWEDGYIMSDLRHTERGFRWSACTVQSFHHFLNGDTATCLHNAPHEDSALGRSLPGTLLSLDAQCRRDRGTYACFKDERVCAQLFCFDAQTGYCVAYRPAAEGSACGNGYHCLDGRCTPQPSNVIPDYGQNYRLVYKNNDIGNKHKTDAATETTEDIENSSEEIESNENENNNDTENEEQAEDEGISSSEEQDDKTQDNQLEQSNAAATAAAVVTTTTTARPKNFEYLRRLLPQLQQQLHSTDDNLALHNTESQWLQNGGVVVRTRTSSSVSSSSSSSSSSSALNQQQHAHHTPTTTTTPKTSTEPNNIFQIYTHEFRKQIEYYLHLLKQPQVANIEHLAKPLVQVQPRTTTFDTNYSATNNNNNNNNNGAKQQNSNNSREGSKRQQQQQQVDQENEANVGIDSNEAIERQKRKFLIHQQQEQQQQQREQQHTTSPAYVTNYLGDNTNNLPAVLANEQSTTATTVIQQQQQKQAQLENDSSATTITTTAPKKQKIKTQKLIRRTRVK